MYYIYHHVETRKKDVGNFSLAKKKRPVAITKPNKSRHIVKAREASQNPDDRVKIDIYQRLPLVTNKALLLLSALVYIYLFLCGIMHLCFFDILKDKLFYHILLLNVEFMYEAMIALLTKHSILSGWRMFDYIFHHLHFAILLCAALKLDAIQPYRMTFIVCLLNCGHDAYKVIKSIFGLNLKGCKFELYDRIFLFIIIILLTISEAFESLYSLLYRNQSLPVHSFIFITLITAPTYHISFAIPACYKKVLKILTSNHSM